MVRVITLRRLAARLAIILPFVAFLYAPSPAFADPILGSTLAKYAVLAYAGVTCDPTCYIGGDVGSAPTAAPAGFNFLFGTVDNANAGTAQTQLTTAVGLVNAGSGTLIPSGDLDAFQALPANGGKIPPGTYNYSSIATLTGDIYLDGGGDNTAVWKFRFGSLTAGTSSNVFVTGVDDGSGVGIYWTTVFEATLNGFTFVGNVMAGSKITSDGNLTMSCGRLLAQTEDVTLIKDTISIDTCLSGGSDQGNPDTGAPGHAVPEPSTLLLLTAGLIGVAARMRRARPR